MAFGARLGRPILFPPPPPPPPLPPTTANAMSAALTHRDGFRADDFELKEGDASATAPRMSFFNDRSTGEGLSIWFSAAADEACRVTVLDDSEHAKEGECKAFLKGKGSQGEQNVRLVREIEEYASKMLADKPAKYFTNGSTKSDSVRKNFKTTVSMSKGYPEVGLKLKEKKMTVRLVDHVTPEGRIGVKATSLEGPTYMPGTIQDIKNGGPCIVKAVPLIYANAGGGHGVSVQPTHVLVFPKKVNKFGFEFEDEDD